MRTAAARRPVLPLAAALALLALPSPSDAKFDPARRWLSAETPHFVVHFPEGYGQLAARAAALAEEAHERLAPRIGWEPRSRTRLILSDDTDAAGGWASPYPYNQMLVTVASPLGEPGFGTTVHDDWLRLVITHEYTHVLELDLASRLPLGLRSVFGRLYFPNALQPQWLIEGLATYEETEQTTGGRGRSPGAEMVLRMATLEDSLPTLDRMAVLPDEWPAGQVPYLFGESFIRHLAQRFGREKVAEISRVYGSKPLPFFVASTGREVLGASYRELWREWSDALRARFREQERIVAARGITHSTALTTDGRLNLSPAWSPDGTRIAWLRADGVDYPGVWVMNADGSGKRRLVKSAFSTATSGTTLAWSPDGSRIFYTKQDVVRGAAVFDDVWACDTTHGRETRLTRGLRARDPNPSSDGRTLALVTGGSGLTRLALLDLGGALPVTSPSRLRYLIERSADQFAEPRWSPDGAHIAVSVRSPDGVKSIRVLDREGRTVAEIGRDPALDGAPSWRPDGSSLWFASDRTGIFNLFAWDVATGDLRQATNVLGGAFSPAVSPDGRRVAFVEYTARGYDIHILELTAGVGGASLDTASHENQTLSDDTDAAVDPVVNGTSEGVARRGGPPLSGPQGAQWRSAATGPRSAPLNESPKVTPDTTGPALRIRPYSALDTVLPRLWLPWIATSAESGTLAGFVTGGQDVLQRHRWLLSALYGPESGRLMHTLSYDYDGLRPTISLLSADVDRTYADLIPGPSGYSDYTERERSVGVEMTLAFPGFESSQSVSVGYRYRYLTSLSPTPAIPPPPDEDPATGNLGAARLGWAYSNARRQPFSISPQDGRSLRLALEHAQDGLGSNRTFTRASADWAEYLALPPHRHVLLARLFGGTAGGDTPAQGAFALGGEALGDVSLSIDDGALPLRGYPLNAFRGDNALLGGLEYRFPLREIGRGGDTAPFFLRRLHGALFVDAGEAWYGGGFDAGELRTGVGAELRLDFSFSYFLPLTLRLGVAWGLDEEGGVYPTLAITTPQGLLGAATPTGRR